MTRPFGVHREGQVLRSSSKLHQSVYKGIQFMTTSKRPARLLDSPIFTTVSRYIGKAHTSIYRRTGGRVGGNLRLGAGFRKPAPTLLLEHRGSKSGKTFVSPLLYITDHSNVIVVASALGRTDNPQWYRNLLAHPDVGIQIGP